MLGSGVTCQQQMHRLATLLTQIPTLIEACVFVCVSVRVCGYGMALNKSYQYKQPGAVTSLFSPCFLRAF